MSVDAAILLRVDYAEARPPRWWETENTLPSWAFQEIAMVPERAPSPPYGGRYAAPLDIASRGRREAP